MKYEVISGPIALDATTSAQTGDVIILDEADGKALVQYQILKPAADDAIAINDPTPPEPETAAQKKKRLADEAAAAATPPAPAPAAPAAPAPAAT